MKNEREKSGCLKFLQDFQIEELLSLVETVTNRMITVESKKDAISAIIQHSDSAVELLRRRKVRKEYIFRHLAAQQVTASATADKETLVQQLLSHWDGTTVTVRAELSTQNSIKEVPQNVKQKGDHWLAVSQSAGMHSSPQQQPIHVQTLATQFTTWFFQQLNSLSGIGGGGGGVGAMSSLSPAAATAAPDWGPKHFWADSQLALRIAGTVEEQQERYEGAELVAQRLEGFVRQEGLLFNPNISPDGVRGWNEAHGLVCVAACGTVHQGGACVGLFEQQVGLIRDPLRQNIWKIKFVKLNLKQAAIH